MLSHSQRRLLDSATPSPTTPPQLRHIPLPPAPENPMAYQAQLAYNDPPRILQQLPSPMPIPVPILDAKVACNSPYTDARVELRRQGVMEPDAPTISPPPSPAAVSPLRSDHRPPLRLRMPLPASVSLRLAELRQPGAPTRHPAPPAQTGPTLTLQPH